MSYVALGLLAFAAGADGRSILSESPLGTVALAVIKRPSPWLGEVNDR